MKTEHVRVAIYLPAGLNTRLADLQRSMESDTGLQSIPLSSVASAVIQRGLDAMQDRRAARSAVPHS